MKIAILNFIHYQNPEILRRFLITNKNLPKTAFYSATENIKSFRRLRHLSNSNRFARWFFWKN